MSLQSKRVYFIFCRAEIIDLYNKLVLTNSNSDYAQKKINSYSKILGIEAGELYEGI